MVSLEDCIAFCGLNEDEVAAISEHEHIPEIAATALADYLLKQPHGGETIRTMIIDDIHGALDAGRVKHAQELFMALRHFLDQHPETRAGVDVIVAQHVNLATTAIAGLFTLPLPMLPLVMIGKTVTLAADAGSRRSTKTA